MDPSALIFIALAVAWAVYLIPKALEHHEESVRSRTVDRFSATLRVLARREPISRRRARLVRAGSSASASAESASSDTTRRNSDPENLPSVSLDESPALTSAQARVRRAAAARAAKRRLRVVTLILLAVAAGAGLAWFDVTTWRWVAAPVGVLVAWLVACRLMVKRERRGLLGRGARGSASARPARPTSGAPSPARASDETGPIPAVPSDDNAAPTSGDPASDPDSWDPVPVTLPTYVSKPVAPRSVRTIDLDSTGVWSSGRSESDSELVRDADAREAEARDSAPSKQRRHA